MASSVLRTAAALMCASMIAALPTVAFAQSPEADAKAAEAKAAGQRKIDDKACSDGKDFTDEYWHEMRSDHHGRGIRRKAGDLSQNKRNVILER